MPTAPLQSDSLGDFELTPDLEAYLNALASRAKSDPAARDALFAALHFKIARFIQRYRYHRRLVVCDLDDVAQEAFLVFCEIIRSWPGDASFPGYFLSRFPWRLSRAVDIIERGWSASRLLPLDSLGESIPPLDPADLFTLSELGAGLRPRDRAVLELHIGYGLRLNEIARLLGVHHRTISRDWQRIAGELRRTLAEPSKPAKDRQLITPSLNGRQSPHAEPLHTTKL